MANGMCFDVAVEIIASMRISREYKGLSSKGFFFRFVFLSFRPWLGLDYVDCCVVDRRP